MISNHYGEIYGIKPPYCRDLILFAIIIAGFLLVRWMYSKAAKVQGF
jgi:hypothetical protein